MTAGSVILTRATAEQLLAARPAGHPDDIDVDLAYGDLALALTREVPWDRVGGLLSVLSRDVEPRVTHGIDQLQAYAAGCLADLGVDVHDERILYETIVAVALVARVAINGRDNGQVGHGTSGEIQTICKTLATALGSLAPPGAVT